MVRNTAVYCSSVKVPEAVTPASSVGVGYGDGERRGGGNQPRLVLKGGGVAFREAELMGFE